MNNNVYNSPALYSHALNGLFLFYALYLLYVNKINDPSLFLIVILLASISFGIHSISHLGLEAKYNFNPLARLIKK